MQAGLLSEKGAIRHTVEVKITSMTMIYFGVVETRGGFDASQKWGMGHDTVTQAAYRMIFELDQEKRRLLLDEAFVW